MLETRNAEYFREHRNDVPKTIQELSAYREAFDLPLEKMRIFVGTDYKFARAFGIYKDADGKVIVYKNKSDGQRVVRYSGFDEEYAVKELLDKIKSEVNNRGGFIQQNTSNVRYSGMNPRGYTYSSVRRPRKRHINAGKFILNFLTRFIICIILFFVVRRAYDLITHQRFDSNKSKWRHYGYYENDGDYYYNVDDDWYYYDYDTNTWDVYYDDDYGWLDDYYISDSEFPYDYSFEDSEYYDDYDWDYYDGYDNYYDSYDSYDYYDDYDSYDSYDSYGDYDDYDSDWDSWDSSDTDWDSDW